MADYHWRIVGDDDDWRAIRAFDAKQAAERAAESHDIDGGGLMVSHGDPIEIEVRSDEDQRVTRWSVWADISVTYYSGQLPQHVDGAAS